MSLMTPVDDTVRGLKTYLAGVRWLRANPRYLLLLLVPAILGVFFLAAGVGWFAGNDERILSWVLFSKPEDSWLMLVVYYLCKVLLYLATIVFVFIASFLLMNVIASPIYEIVSVAVERDVTGRDIPGQSIKEMLYVMVVELKKVVLILTVSPRTYCSLSKTRPSTILINIKNPIISSNLLFISNYPDIIDIRYCILDLLVHLNLE